ncbi:MAG: tetratricopeptide repeat protein, partial [Solirubrobacteraceae bacterium]
VWLAHGSVDWLWEFPVLSGLALALIGAVLALNRPETEAEASTPARSETAQRAVVFAAVAVVLAGALVFLPTFVSDRETRAAARDGQRDPQRAYDKLERARALNPLKVTPWLIEGRIAQRGGDLPRSARAYRHAAERDRLAWFPRFALGLIASARGDRAAATGELRAASERNPRDPVVRDALKRVNGAAPMGFDEARRRFDEHVERRRGRA